eukprot:4146820-Lingulodinium_polyedra.AAC.1
MSSSLSHAVVAFAYTRPGATLTGHLGAVFSLRPPPCQCCCEKPASRHRDINHGSWSSRATLCP